VADARRILVTGATGKVGQALLGRLLAPGGGPLPTAGVRALCHNRPLEPGPRLANFSTPLFISPLHGLPSQG